MKFPTLQINAYLEKIKSQKGIFSIWGDFGVGKTTFALQTALNTVKNGYKIIFIYTKPNLPISKIGVLFNETAEFLDKIIFIKPINFNDLAHIVLNIEFLLLKQGNEKISPYNLIVIDSLTELYRIELNQDKKEKNYDLNYQLNQTLATLSFLNEIYSVNVLITNEATKQKVNDQFIEIQSGGKVMDYWLLFDIKIERIKQSDSRKFILKKHHDDQLIEFISILTEKGFM